MQGLRQQDVATRLLVAERAYNDIPDVSWSGCPDEQEATREVSVNGSVLHFRFETVHEYAGLAACALAVAHVVFSRLDTIDTVVVQLRGGGRDFLEVELERRSFLELDAMAEHEQLGYESHKVQEDGTLSETEKKRRLDALERRWHRQVTSRIPPEKVRYGNW